MPDINKNVLNFNGYKEQNKDEHNFMKKESLSVGNY